MARPGGADGEPLLAHLVEELAEILAVHRPPAFLRHVQCSGMPSGPRRLAGSWQKRHGRIAAACCIAGADAAGSPQFL
jgi:hypothetical protein